MGFFLCKSKYLSICNVTEPTNSKWMQMISGRNGRKFHAFWRNAILVTLTLCHSAWKYILINYVHDSSSPTSQLPFFVLSLRQGSQQNPRSKKYFRIHHREALLVTGANPQRGNADRHQSWLPWIWLIPFRGSLFYSEYVHSEFASDFCLLCLFGSVFLLQVRVKVTLGWYASCFSPMELRFGKVMPESFLLVSLHFAFLGPTKTDTCRVSFLALLRFLPTFKRHDTLKERKIPLDAIRSDAKSLFHIRFTELEIEDIDVFRQSRLWAGLSKSEGIQRRFC